MKRLRRHPEWRLWIGLSVVACIGVLIAGAATWATGRFGGSSDAAFVLPTVVRSGQPVTHTVYKRVTKHLPPRTVIRHGKTVQLPGRTVSRLVAVSVPGPTVAGPTRTVTGPGGVTTVIRTEPGTTITEPGTTVTGPGTTVTDPGTTITEPGTTVTETVTEPGTTVTETITVTTSTDPPPPST